MGIKETLQDLAEAVIHGRHQEAESLTRSLLDAGAGPGTILEEGLLPGMESVGKQFRENKVFLPHVLVSARAMKVSMRILDPLFAASPQPDKGSVLIGTVKGDVHDIGKNLVGVMLTGAGFRVIDAGIQCSAEQFVAAYERDRPDIVALSALLTTTMTYMKPVIDMFRRKGYAVPIIVGGAPVSQAFADQIGAQGYARTAMDAVDLVKRLLS